MPNPSLEVRLRVLAAIDVAPGTSIRSRIVVISQIPIERSGLFLPFYRHNKILRAFSNSVNRIFS